MEFELFIFSPGDDGNLAHCARVGRVTGFGISIVHHRSQSIGHYNEHLGFVAEPSRKTSQMIANRLQPREGRYVLEEIPAEVLLA